MANRRMDGGGGPTMSDKTGNLYRTTSFRNGGRKAGIGTLYDDYGDESYGYVGQAGSVRVRMPHDGVKPEELNGPVICYKEEHND